jgi:hypothetical protein
MVLLLIACAPLVMAAGGGPGNLSGVKFNDLNQNGVKDAGEPGLIGWTIHLFDTGTMALLQTTVTSAPDGFYTFSLPPGNYTVCEALQAGWTQTAPCVAGTPATCTGTPILPGVSLATCTGLAPGLGPLGYTFTVGGFELPSHIDFGNFQGEPLQVGIRGIKFNDLNGNGVRDPGEPGIPGWGIDVVVVDGTAEQPQSGPSVRATIRVDRHTRRPPGGERPDTCDAGLEGCSTTTGGRASIVLTQGPLRAEAVFNVDIPFQLGCVDGLPKAAEIVGAAVSDGLYIPLSNYWMPPPDVLASLFAKIGVPVDPPAYFPVIKEVTARDCPPDPNPVNTVGVRNPGILVVEAAIGFVSTVTKVVVVASTSTNAAGEYEFQLPPGTYTVCESLPPGWRQTFPAAGPGSASCTGTGTGLGPRGHVVTLVDPVDGVNFGNTPFVSGLAALGDAQLWLGLKNSDDQGSLFDVKVELFKNGNLVASGLRRCVAGLTRNPTLAKGIVLPWDDFNPVPLAPTDVLALKVSTRIGTNPDDTKCAPERRSSHTSARGLRLYYDAASRPSHFDATLTSDSNQARYLDSNGTACPAGGGESSNVTDRILTSAAPSAAAAKCKDSSAITFGGGNLFKEVGTWKLQ